MEGRSQQLRDSRWEDGTPFPSPEPGQRGIIVLETLERVYSVRLLGGKTEIPV